MQQYFNCILPGNPLNKKNCPDFVGTAPFLNNSMNLLIRMHKQQLTKIEKLI
ncbi:hypothetical protein ABIB50_000604 [Mucilaginibacter sp. UYCu711]